MSKLKISLRLLAAAVAIAALIAAGLYAGRTTRTTDGASVVTTTAVYLPAWIMNTPQYQSLRDNAGYTGPPPKFSVCNNGGGEDADPCLPGLVPSYENYYTLRTALRHGTRGYVLLDLEGWIYTPHYQSADEAKYYRLAAELCARYGVRLIATPVVPAADGPAVEAAAAKAGAWAVELQIQFATSDPPAYQQLTERAVAAIRAVSHRTVIIDGIASDAGGYPTTAALMAASWDRTHTLVSGYWLNMAEWHTHHNGSPATGCAPDGCVTVAARFLKLIGE